MIFKLLLLFPIRVVYCTFVPSFVRSFVSSFVRPFDRSCARSLVPLFIRLFVCSVVWSFVRSFVWSFFRLIVRLIVRLFVRSLIPSSASSFNLYHWTLMRTQFGSRREVVNDIEKHPKELPDVRKVVPQRRPGPPFWVPGGAVPSIWASLGPM